MPIFEFVCNDCQHNYETIAKRDEIPSCPSCKSENIEKKISICAFASHNIGGVTVKRSAPPRQSGGCGPCSASSCSSCGKK